MKITLKTALLQAALLVAAKKDVRYYLQGVCLSFENDNQLVYVGTDGHTMFASVSHLEGDHADVAKPFQLIIPRETLEQVLKGYKAATIELETTQESGWYKLGYTLFQPIDGRYPDYMRVIPGEPSGELAQYNPEYLAKVYKAVALANGHKDHTKLHLSHNGSSSGVVIGESRGSIGLVMPMRVDKINPYTKFLTIDAPVKKAA